MMQKIQRLLVAIGVLAVLFGLLRLRACAKKHEASGGHSPSPTILQPNDTIAIHVDEIHHTIVTETKNGETKTQFENNPTIHVENNGQVKIDTHPLGLKFVPFVGLGWDTGPRLDLGVSWYHFWRLDLNSQVCFTLDDARSSQAVTTVTSLSYNFYHNTSIFVGIDLINTALNQRPTVQSGVFVAF